MNIYSVYIDSSKNDMEPILIKQGFSFIAGFFNFFWSIYHKMWSVAFVMIILNSILGAIEPTYITYSINLAILFIFGFFASEIREYYALKSGCTLSDIILASCEEEAEVKYYTRAETIKNI